MPIDWSAAPGPGGGRIDWGKPPTPPPTGYDRALAEERKSLKGQEWAVPAEMGISFGQGPDIDATITRAHVAAENLGRTLTGQPIPYTSDEAARATGAGEREAAAGFRQRHPVASLAEEVGGGLTTALTTAGIGPEAAAGSTALKAAPGMLSRVLRSALTGAGFGAATGEGEAGGDIKHRAGAAATGGVVGAALGGAAPLAEGPLQAVFRGANRMAQGAGFKGWQSATQLAEEHLRDALRQDGVTPEKIKAAVSEWRSAGVGATKLLEVAGENTMGVIRAASSRFGPGRNIAALNAAGERANLGQNAAARASALTPVETRSAPEVRQALDEEREALAAAQYRPAYAKPIGVPPKLVTELQDQEGRNAITAAIKGERANKEYETVKQLQTLQGVIDAIGKIDPKVPPAVREKMVQQYLGKVQTTGGAVDAIRRAMNSLGKTTSKTNARYGGGLFDRAHGISDILDEIPELKEARATYHMMSDKMRGLDIGEAALTKPASQFTQLLKTAGGQGKSPRPMTPEMLEQARTGARQWLQDELGKKATTSRATLDRIATAPDVHRNLEALFGKEEAARYVKDAQLRIHRVTRAQDISPRTGSQSTPRAADLIAMARNWKGLPAKLAGDLLGGAPSDAENEALVRLSLGDPTALIRSLTRRPVLQQALARTAPLVGAQAGRTVATPAE